MIQVILSHINQWKWLLLVLLVASTLRLWDLPNSPPGLTWDETSLGYNAYSLLLTGRDEYGELLPLHLKSFGDYKPALYAYLTIPFVAIFGLTELAVRLPSALLGIISVYVTYLLVYELFKKKYLAAAVAFASAVSPFAIQFSRPAFEANAALFLNIFATYLFIKSFNNRYLLIFSSIVFGLSLFTYQSARLFTPLLMIGLLYIYRKSVKIDKYLKASLGIFLALIFVVVGLVIIKGEASRLAALNYFSYRRTVEEIELIQSEDGLNSLPFSILHGEWFTYVRGLFERYLIYFSPKLLFSEGDYNPRFRVPDLGVLHYYSLILIPIGIFYLINQKSNGSRLVFFWLLLSPVPAVLSRDLVSSIRALNLVLPLSVLEGAGLYILISYILKSERKLKILMFAVLVTTMVGNLSVYVDRYFLHSPKAYSEGWLFGHKEMVKTLLELNRGQYDKVIVSDSYGQPYIYYLFYSQYPPLNFQKQAVLDQPSIDVGTIRRIDNIEFRHIYWPEDRSRKNNLFLGTLEELPDKDILPFGEFKLLKDIRFLNNLNAFRIVETNL